MFAPRIIKTLLLCLFIAAGIACRQQATPPAVNNSTAANQPPAPAPPASSSSPSQETPAVAPPASVAELREVVQRIYKTAVTIDESRRDMYVVGDFNGDDSEDIAVAVKPGKGMLAELNSEYAGWILEDPRAVMVMEVHKDVKKFPEKPAPVVVRQNDNLLAVIHGHQEAGWRNPKATQTYLLRNAVGGAMKTEHARSLLNQPTTEAAKEQLPPLRGDVIQQMLAGSPGFIYWTGAKYAWHSDAAVSQ
ncbi:MAG: hypothetical protein QOF02_1792 [Blastocatellia bacterium]|jgi:hypothetical protein|nr:hypothetical protein [Blastocatellia bacterium]